MVTRRRAVWPFVLGGVVALVAIAAAAAYVFAAPYFFASGFRTAAYFPRDTWAYGAMTVRPGFSQLMAGKTLVDAFTGQPDFDKAIQALQSSAQPSSTVDYQKEIQPLLDGEIAVGAFGSTTQPDAVYMLHSNDPEKLLRLLAVADKAPEPRDRYKDALLYVTAAGRAAAASKGWVVGATSRTIMEQALDRLDSPPTDALAQNDRFTSVVNRLPSERIGFLYFDSRPVMTSPAVRQSLAQATAFQTYLAPLTARAGMSLAAASDGVDLRWESIPDQPLHSSTSVPRGSALTAFDRLPSDTLLAMGGDSLPSMLAGLDTAMNASLTASMGSSAPKITFQFDRWMGGEFAAGFTKGTLRLDSRGAATQGAPDLFLVARVKDTNAASADLNALDKLLPTKPTTIQGVALKQLGTTPDSSAYYGVGGDWFYVLSGEPDKLLGQGTGSGSGLTASSQFGMVRRAIAADGISLFADLQNGRRTMEDLFTTAQHDSYDKSRVLLQPIKALGGGFRTEDNGDTHGQLLLAISK